MYAIEKGVPIPPAGVRWSQKYPFAQMEVGDSFFAPRPRNMLSAAASRVQKRLGWRFATAVEVDATGQSGTRVWRTE